MLHVQPTKLPCPAASIDPDVALAKRWIAGARECGLVVFPWFTMSAKTGELSGGVMECGQDIDGPNDYGAGTKRFLKHPARDAVDGCRKGMVFDVLCDEYGVHLGDADFCDKVNARLKTQAAKRNKCGMQIRKSSASNRGARS